MISHKYKAIFIHIPKCAGTSIEKCLGHFDDYSGISRQDHRSIRMIEPINVQAFSSIENIKELIKRLLLRINPPPNPRSAINVTREQYQNYFKFTVVRNPWSRAYSWYRSNIINEAWRKRHNLSKDITFPEFLELHLGKKSLRPQTFWLINFCNKIPLNYIGKFENINEDFNEICRLMNVNHIKLPHELNRGFNDYKDVYDENSKNLIKEIYKEEIQLFNYTFDS